jgi:SWI/SNF chromatin-remodeling complex subunit SWI1
LQDQRGKVSMAGRQGMPAQQFPASTGAPRSSLGMPNTQQLGMRPMNSNNLIPQGLPGGSIPSNDLAQYSSVHNPPTQHRPSSSASLPIGSLDTHTTMPSELDSLMHAVDSNLLDPDIQGIKRKHDQDDRDIKRVRQKTGMLKPYITIHLLLCLAYYLNRSTRREFRRYNLYSRVPLTHPLYLT